MATSSTTLPISVRGGLLPVMRYGNYAGPGYAGSLGAESTITDPSINSGRPILVSVLTQTPQGLASFMKLALQTEPNGYLDSVTRNHDVEYTVAEMRFMTEVQTQFGKLPHELTSQDRQDPAYTQLETARNGEYWQADQRMLTSAAQYKPADFVDVTYRGSMLTAFYVKAESGLVGYGLGAQVDAFYGTLKAIDSGIGVPTTGQSINTLGTANSLARSDFETLATLPITPQERQFFNSHLQAGQYLNSSSKNADGSPVTYDTKDSTNRIVVPERMPDGRYFVRTQINGDTVTMILDKTDERNPVFTKEIAHNGQVVSVETIRPDANDSVNQGQASVRAYTSVVQDGAGNVLETHAIAKPSVPTTEIPPDLQQKIDAVKSGSVEQILSLPGSHTNTSDTDGSDAHFLQYPPVVAGADEEQSDTAQAEASTQSAETTSTGADGSDAHLLHHPAPEDSTPIADAAYEQLVEAFSNTDTTTNAGAGVQYADAGNSGVVSDAGGGSSASNQPAAPAAPAEPAQPAPETIAEQTPPTSTPATPAQPFVQYGSEYNATLQPYASALNLLKSLDGLQHWDKLGDVGQLTTAMSLYTQLDSLGTTYGSGEHNLLGGSGYMGSALSAISLAQSIESGNTLGILSSANALSGQAVDSAINAAVGSTGVPYVGILMALNNFEAHPGQAIGSLVGMCFGPIGSMVGGLIGGLLDDAFGPHPSPPQAQGEIHFEWNAQGDIHTVVDVNRHAGGASATGVAHSVQSMLEQLVQSLNAQTLQQHPDTPASELMAINPNLLPRIGFSANNSTHKPVTWMEITQPDGSVSHESLSQDDLAQRLLTLLTDNGGLAAQWLVDTQEAHYHQLVDTGADAATLQRELHAGQGGHSAVGNQAFALEGNASESADFKSQSFGALVVHERAVAQTIDQITTLQVLRDAENDGFLEPSEWVAAADDLGRTQGLLVIDFNRNGQIETRDILNLGGNSAEPGNHSTEATQANSNADLQRNNVQWLDANGDGTLDAHDPAFAAIKLWVDSNADGFMQGGESQGLAALQITALNFQTGEVTYADGHTEALTAKTLHADTEGVRLTQIQEVVLDENGVAQLHALDAGTVLEHEGYAGQAQTTDDGGTRWGAVRKSTFEHQAKATTRISFVPQAQSNAQAELRIVTREMIQNADSTLFAGLGSSGATLGVLAAVGAGMAASGGVLADTLADHGDRVDIYQRDGEGMVNALLVPAVTQWSLVDANGVRTPMVNPVFLPAGTIPSASTSTTALPLISGAAMSATLVVDFKGAQGEAVGNAGAAVQAQALLQKARISDVDDEDYDAGGDPEPGGFVNGDTVLALPVLQGETLQGTEDTIINIASALLLANDSSANQATDPGRALLTVSAVGHPVNGYVALVNGEVVFVPNANFNGTASFSYTVTDQYGLFSTATATLLIAAVNDAPVVCNELIHSDEDAALLFDPALLLANDTDVDIATNGQVLSIVAVSNAQHGTVTLRSDGQIAFVPDANYFGSASFDYTVSDGNGATRVGSTTLQLAPVNDAPVALDDQFQTYVDSTMTIAFAQLTGNDTDVEGDLLTVSAVQNSAHGVVSIVAGQVQFVATPGYIGAASFDYLSDDGHGGQTWATAFVEVKPPPNLYPTIDVHAGSHHSHWFGGSAYYNPIELWQSFGYVIHDESPGSVVMGITPADSGYLTSAPSGGGFEYYKYDSWGADGLQMYFDIHLTDQNGVSNTAHVALGCDGDTWNSLIVTHDHTGLFTSPVLIDLMGDGFTYQAADVSTVRFDVNADGSADQIAWVGQDDGVLVWDKDANGQISDASEFSFQSLKAGAHTDLEGLQALDSNHNGTLDAGDTAWTQFGVWQDKNGNGNTDATEFKTLDQLGFASIHLQSNGQMHEATAVGGDVVVMGEAAFTRTDGSSGAVADAMLAYVPTQPGAQPNAEINRMALLFNQMVNTADTDSAEPLGFVPVEPDMGAHYAPLLAAQNDHQLLQTA